MNLNEIYPQFNVDQINNFSSNNCLIIIISQIVILIFSMNPIITPQMNGSLILIKA